MTNENDIFSTRDLYLAATLVTLKFYSTGLDYQFEGDKRPIGFFKFKNTPEIQEAKAKYSQGLLLVEPKMFITNLKSLKSDVVNMFNNPHLDR